MNEDIKLDSSESNNRETIEQPAVENQAQPDTKEYCSIKTPQGFEIQMGSCYYDSITLSQRILDIIQELKSNNGTKPGVNYTG